MDNSNSVNDQVTDSVSQMNTLLISSSAPQSLGIVDIAGAEALSMFMYNAVSAQQNAQISSAAATTSVCAKILQAQPPKPAAPTPAPAPNTPPPFMSLSSGITANDLLAQANTLAQAAVQSMNHASTNTLNSADLNQLIQTLQSIQKNNPPTAAPTTQSTAAPTTNTTAAATSSTTNAPTSDASTTSASTSNAPASGGTEDPEKKS